MKPPSRGRRSAFFGLQDAGRWALIRPPVTGASVADGSKHPEAVEHIARTLLRRYGVVCWRLLEREAAWLPPWRELVRVYHRLEARGEIRGGRFIAGIPGEQFALPDAVGLMRQIRRNPLDGGFVRLSASDPANLLGTLIPGTKVPRVPGARVLYRDGVPIATNAGGQVEFLTALTASEQQTVQRALIADSLPRLQGITSDV